MANSREKLEIIFNTTDQKFSAIEAKIFEKMRKMALASSQFVETTETRLKDLDATEKSLCDECDVAVAGLARKAQLEEMYKDENRRRERQLCDLEQLQESINERRTSLAKDKQELKDTKTKIGNKLRMLKECLSMYRDALGLDITKIDGKLRFTFININRDDPEEAFTFHMNVIKDKFVVSECCPAVDDMDALVAKLQRENDLRRFVVEVRKRFCVLAKTPRAASTHKVPLPE